MLQTPTAVAITNHCVAASQSVSGFKIQLKTAIIAVATDTMKKMSDVDLIPIFSPPVSFYFYFFDYRYILARSIEIARL
jgi:hypothetical protein